MDVGLKRTTSKCSYLSGLFPPGDPPDLLSALIARLCVLYEDLRIESSGAAAIHIECLDALQPLSENPPPNTGFYRVIYFLRRLTGTLHEFADALAKLNAEPSFQIIRSRMPAATRELWDDSLRYFAKEKRLLASVRNDVGGHFGIAAARFAVANLPSTATARIEMRETAKGLETLLYFAGELVSTAILRNLDGKDTGEKVGRFFREHLMVASRHATNCVHAITIEYLYPRLGH